MVLELDVLVATALWLWRERRVQPARLSIASGAGLPRKTVQRQRLRVALTAAGVPDGWSVVADGPDFEGCSDTEYWRVECKGAGTGQHSTQRNSFDRALASAVSYFDETPADKTRFIGLAVASTDDYLQELRRRVRGPLRDRLGLWLLLYDGSSGKLAVVPPNGEWTDRSSLTWA